MKTISEINPTNPMSKEDFLTLFKHLPLTPAESSRLEIEYFAIYLNISEASFL